MDLSGNMDLSWIGNHLVLGEVIQHNEDREPGPVGAMHKFPTSFHKFRPFKMVANLTYCYDVILAPQTSILLNLEDYRDDEAGIMRDVPNLVDGSFHQTVLSGWGPENYGGNMYIAVPSFNPDPRIRIPIPGEHVVRGVRLFEASIKQSTLKVLFDLGYSDSEAPIILHGIVSRGDFSSVRIIVTNTGTEDFALADIGKVFFTVMQVFDMIATGGPYNIKTLRSYFVHPTTVSPNSTSDEEDDNEEDDAEGDDAEGEDVESPNEEAGDMVEQA